MKGGGLMNPMMMLAGFKTLEFKDEIGRIGIFASGYSLLGNT